MSWHQRAREPIQGLSGVEVDLGCLDDMNGPQTDAMGDNA